MPKHGVPPNAPESPAMRHVNQDVAQQIRCVGPQHARSRDENGISLFVISRLRIGQAHALSCTALCWPMR